MNCLIVAALLGFGTQSEPTITYTCPGVRAKLVFEELSKQAGQTLLIGQSLAEEPIILRLDKAPLAKTMDRLAFALNGEWVKEKEGTRLVAKKLSPEETPYNLRLKKIIAMQKAAKDELATTKPFDAKSASTLVSELEAYFKKLNSQQLDESTPYESGNEFEERGPDIVFGKQILLMLDPKRLAESENRERIVWSTHPTARQRPAPPGVWKLAVSYLQQSLLWRNQLQRNSDLLGRLNEYSYAFSHLIPYYLDESLQSSRSLTQPIKLNIETYSFSGRSIILQMTFLNQNSKVVQESFSMFSEPTGSISSPLPDPVLKPMEKPIVIRSLALELSNLIASWQLALSSDVGDYNPPKFSKEFLNALTHPEITDPLAISAGPTLIQYAEEKGEQLVAVLSDSQTYGIRANPEGVLDQSRFLRWFRPGNRDYRVENRDGWITIGLITPISLTGYSALKRMPRNSSGPFLRQVIKDNFVSIETASTFFEALQPDPSSVSYLSVAFPLDRLQINSEILDDSSSITALQLFSSLSPLQMVAIRNGEELGFKNLSEKQKTILRYELFVKLMPPLTMGGEERSLFGGDFLSNELGYLEPTERYAPDIHPNARMKVAFNPNPIVEALGADSDGDQISRNFSPSELLKGLEAEAQEGAQLKKFRVLNRRTLTILIQLDKEIAMKFEATEVRGNSPFVDSIDKLPSEILQQIRKDMAKYKAPGFLKRAS